MTHSPTPAELLAIRTGNAALLNSPDSACDIVSTIVFALGSAQLLQSPETAKELTARRTEDVTLRGELSPAYGPRRVPMELGSSLVPAVQWLLARVAELEARAAVIEDAAPTVVAKAMAAHGIAPQILADPAMRGKCGRALSTGQPCPVHDRAEDPHDSELHRPYALGRDLPEPGVRS